MTTITIKEKSHNSQGEYEAIIAFNHEGEVPCTFTDPFSAEQAAELDWYFSQYVKGSFEKEKADARAKIIADEIKNYGKQLFSDIFEKNPSLLKRYAKINRAELALEISGSPAFHTLHWETLHDPDEPQPLALDIPIIRKYTEFAPLEIPETPTINLLIVTARPFGKRDVNYRSISGPLVASLRQIDERKLRVKMDILRPGTYHALTEHLASQPKGHYHIIHFDVHGALLTHAQLQQGCQEKRYSYENLKTFTNHNTFANARICCFGNEVRFPETQVRVSGNPLRSIPETNIELAKVLNQQPFLFLETGQDQQSEPIPAQTLAHLLRSYQIPLVILNACESGKQVGLTETSLSGQFMQAGIPMVLAMRYTVTASAAILFMPVLYENLFAKQDVTTAIRRARGKLHRDQKRRDGFNQQITLEDWIMPVVYQNTTVTLPIRDFTPAEKSAYYAHTPHRNPTPPYQFLGRDWEVHQIEAQLFQRNILLIQGISGIGKTTLLHHLGQWWQHTGFIQKVFYYDEKPWTPPQILATLAEQLLAPDDKNTFALLSSVEQQTNMVAQHLRSQPHLLIVDGLTCLPEPAKTTWHNLLVDLVKGKTFVLLGSQQEEKWLATGTFEDNIYQLAGIDGKSAFILLKSTLERQQINYANDKIHELHQQLAQHPLLLEIVARAIVKNQTALLSALHPEITKTDIQSEAKLQSILHAVFNYIYDTLAPNEQSLLLCLAPLKFAININTLPEYSQQLRQHPVLTHLPFNNWEKVLEKVADWELLRLHPDMLLQSAFADFLRNRLSEKASLQEAIETVFAQYCDKMPTTDFATQPQMSNQNDVQTPTPNEGDVSAPTSMSSIDLYNRIRRLPKPLFNDICFYLKEKYDYDLAFIDVNGVPADAAHQLIEFLKLYPQGFNHLQQLLEERRLL